MTLFSFLEKFDYLIWTYLGTVLILLFGFLLTYRARFVQLFRFVSVIKLVISYLKETDSPGEKGIHPIKALSAEIGGAIGVGNIVGVVTAIQIGGPGALLWVWIAAFFGMILKYSEVYLGMRYRKKNKFGSYDGGPMFFLKKAFNNNWLPILVCFLLCVYGAEIYIFSVILDAVSINWEVNRILVMVPLLLLVLWGAAGGFSRIGKICSILVPLFIVLYLVMSGWVIIQNLALIPTVLGVVLKSAFIGHAPIGGFVGSSIALAMSQGIARGCYSGDIGIGYASIVHSESSEDKPEKQAILTFLGIFLDTFLICTLSILLVLLTGVWSETTSSSMLVQQALSQYFPFMKFFMPLFLFLLGYSTLITYLCFGTKSANFISEKNGKKVYWTYAICMFILFSFIQSGKALLIMSIAGGLLTIINVLGIYRLRKEINFQILPSFVLKKRKELKINR